MKRLSVCLILFLFYQNIYAQQYVYAPVMIDLCTGRIDSSIVFILDNKAYLGFNEPFEIPYFSLPDTGAYIIYTMFEMRTIHVQEAGVLRDTFYKPRFSEDLMVGSGGAYRYYYCGEEAEGNLQDYYPNGGLRIEGTFKNSFAIDSVKLYYESGGVKEIRIRHLKKHFRFHENGVIASFHDWQKGDYRDYYPSGQISEIGNYIEKKAFNRKYFENGGLKSFKKRNLKLDYYQNGIIKRRIKRKRINILETMFSDFWPKEYKYKEILRDSSGQTLRKISWQYSTYFLDSLRDIDPYQFVEIQYYKNGEAFLKCSFGYKKVEGGSKVFVEVFKKEQDDWMLIQSAHGEDIYTTIERLEMEYYGKLLDSED